MLGCGCVLPAVAKPTLFRVTGAVPHRTVDRYRACRHPSANRDKRGAMTEPGDRGRHRRGARWWQRGPYVSSHRKAADLPERQSERVTERSPELSVERMHAVTAPVVDDRPQYTWRDFELDDQPMRAHPHSPDTPDLRDGRRHCGPLERVLYRQWDAMEGPPSADSVRAVDSLARLPEQLKTKLAIGLDGIYVGRGGVPDLDDMGYLRGAPLPSGRATWDICAG